MPVAIRANVFDERDSVAPKEAGKAGFKFAPTFIIDLAFTAAYLAVVMPNWMAAARYGVFVSPTFVIAALFSVCYVGKILVVRHLDRKGGDARAYVKSEELVADGPFAYSRHPTYTLAFVQFLLWSALALYLQAFEPWRPLMTGAAIALPIAFFLLNDWIVMPSEEAMLAELHPGAYPAYAAHVRRWFGRR
jgi:protein-S-isoprenylcysteine O-methyltransferase Ste14